MRLVQAAIKYHFKLVLAGSVNSDADFSPIKSLIDTHDNISYLGRVPDAELYQHNEVSYRQHIAIVDAIRRRDPDEADRALQTHLNSVSATWHAFGQHSSAK